MAQAESNLTTKPTAFLNAQAPDAYRDLEYPISDVRNMADIVIHAMEGHGGFEAGNVTISARSRETFSFAVYHLQELIDGLHKQYFRDCEAGVSIPA
jgi:hypothetical protein